MKYPLAFDTWGEEEIKKIHDVIHSNQFTMGKEVENFEKEFAKKFNTKYALMCNSGSSANLLMVASLFFSKKPYLKQGDEVIVPAVSWATTFTPLQQYGLKIKFIDIDKDTLNISIKSLKQSISEKTKLIFLVNLLGNPNDFDEIKEIQEKYNIPVVEDNCESLAASFNGKYAGTFGLMGSYSTFYSHHICTMEGGLVTTDDEELYHILLSLRSHGWTRHLPTNNQVTGQKSSRKFEESFNFVLPGYNLRPTEISGATGSVQLKKLDLFIEKRKENAKYFLNKFASVKNIRLQSELGSSSWFGFSFLLEEELKGSRNDLVDFLLSKDIDCRPIVAGDFSKNEVIKYFDHEIPYELKNASCVEKNGFFVGNSHTCLKDEIDYLYRTMGEFFHGKGLTF